MPLPTNCTSVETIALKRNTTTTVVLKSCDLTSPVQPSNLNYAWLRNGAPLDLTGTHFTVNQYGLLTIKNISRSDLGVYQVSISNSFGSAVHTIKLVAESSVLPGATQSQRSQDNLGELATIYCNITSQKFNGLITITMDPCAHIIYTCIQFFLTSMNNRTLGRLQKLQMTSYPSSSCF
jgi:hypothetical protein